MTDLPDAETAQSRPLLTVEERDALVRKMADGPLRWVSREYADWLQIRLDKSNEIIGCLEPLLESIIADRLAAASGPWAEHLDAANAQRIASADALIGQLDAALARNAELQHEVEGLAWRNQQLTERLEQAND